MMRLIVNGKEQSFGDNARIKDIFAFYGLACEGTAVAVNDDIVALTDVDIYPLHEGDRIELIRAIGGG